MSRPLTIYECPKCHAIGYGYDRVVHQDCDQVFSAPLHVRVFHEEDVRKLWDCCYDASGNHLAPDDFPAPEEWTA